MESLRQLVDKLLLEKTSSNHIVLPFGCDSAYNDASQNYQSIDKVIQYWNDLNGKINQNVVMIYSTPNTYVRELQKSNRSK